MTTIDSFVNRLKKIGINVQLSSNYPWLYLYRVNRKKVTELIPLKKYKLKATGGFCHAYSMNKSISSLELKWDKEVFTFLNFIDLEVGKRAIFMTEDSIIYLMNSADNLKFVVNEVL